MWQRLPALLQYLFIPFSTKMYHFLSNHTAACLTVRYSLITKFWPMRCKHSCVTPLEVSFKEQDTLFLTPSSFLLAGKQTRYLKLEQPSWIPSGEVTCPGWNTIMRRNLNLELFQDAILSVLDCSLLDFYVRNKFLPFKSLLFLIFLSLTANLSQQPKDTRTHPAN